MSLTSRLFAALLTAAIFLPAVGLGQENAKQLLAKAYAETKKADTVDNYATIIDLCQQAQQATELTEERTKYSKQLLAWAFNRRGEAYVEQAATALEDDEEDQAAELDAKALSDFEAAIENDPQRWKAIHNRGVSNAITGEYPQAIKDFSRVLELKPEYGNAWFNRGEILYELGKYQQAIEDYSQTIELEPDDSGAFVSRGHAHFQLRNFADALKDYTQATELDDQNSDVFANRGDAYQALQMWAEAAADFRRAIKLDPGAVRAYQAAGWLMATCPDKRFRNVELGVQAAERAAELSSDEDIEALDTLAAAYANAGRFEEAVETASRAVELASGDDVKVLRERLEFYNAEQPYRQRRYETARAETATETQ
jgi:tetratricopeptide (TPR) repeat protein